MKICNSFFAKSRYGLFFIVSLCLQTMITVNCFAANAANDKAVTIENMDFSPSTLAVSVGTTVIWTNQDTTPHTVTSKDKELKSDTLSQGESYSHTFTKAGKYTYFCSIHPSMKGKVIVKANNKK